MSVEAPRTKTIFQKIWDRELPAYELYRCDDWRGNGFMVILDVNPATPGHVMIIPRQDEGRPVAKSWLDLDPVAHQQATALGWLVSQKLMEATGARNIIPANFGDQVPHVHYHFMPQYATPAEGTSAPLEDFAFGEGAVLDAEWNPIQRMHPDSGRVAARPDHDALRQVFEHLQPYFADPEFIQQADRTVAGIGAMAIATRLYPGAYGDVFGAAQPFRQPAAA